VLEQVQDDIIFQIKPREPKPYRQRIELQ